MSAQNAWGGVQDFAYQLDRAIATEASALLLVGAEAFPQARTLLKEAGDRVRLARDGVDALAPKTKKRKEARTRFLRFLTDAEAQGAEAAALLFQEKVKAKDVARIHAAIGRAVALEIDALQALLDLRD